MYDAVCFPLETFLQGLTHEKLSKAGEDFIETVLSVAAKKEKKKTPQLWIYTQFIVDHMS